MAEYIDYVKIAIDWRNTRCLETSSDMYFKTGVVLIWNGRVYCWKNQLRDARHERPGVVAVDCHDHVFRAEGGNDYDGAAAWVVYEPRQQDIAH
ncbi:antirestriction protein ArdR [Salmonella enterica subsp. enterica serovar Newport]